MGKCAVCSRSSSARACICSWSGHGKEAPRALFLWLGFALVLNFGLQVSAYFNMRRKNAGAAIVTGNRNIALFLVALPPEIVDELLLFIGCYQIPMYLTPLVMSRVMRSDEPLRH